jgi:outer membrane protein assembly factor BamB
MKHPSKIFSFVAVLMMLHGCTTFKLQQSIRVTEHDWMMYGGNGARTNFAEPLIVNSESQSVWEYDVAAGFSSYSAAAADSFVFAANLQGEVHAIHIRTGDNSGVYDFGASIVGTPVLIKNRIYVALTNEEKNVVAYDLDFGRELWRVGVGDVESSPLLLDGVLYLTTLSGKLVALSIDDGKERWSLTIPKSKFSSMIRSSPATDGERIVFGCDNGMVYAVGKNGSLLWSAQTGASIVASPSIVSGKVFVGSLDGCYYAFDVATGKQLWKRSLGSKIFGSQACDNANVYVGTSGGALFCLAQNSGDIVWRWSAKSVINSAPLISGDRLYIGCLDKKLYAVAISTGQTMAEIPLRGRIKTTPLVADGYLVVAVEDRSLFAFKGEATK